VRRGTSWKSTQSRTTNRGSGCRPKGKGKTARNIQGIVREVAEGGGEGGSDLLKKKRNSSTRPGEKTLPAWGDTELHGKKAERRRNPLEKMWIRKNFYRHKSESKRHNSTIKVSDGRRKNPLPILRKRAVGTKRGKEKTFLAVPKQSCCMAASHGRGKSTVGRGEG